MIRRRLEAGQSKMENLAESNVGEIKHNKAAEVLFPATCRCSSLSVFSGYSNKHAMPGLLQKLIEIGQSPNPRADRPFVILT
jgi:hypothetical protein